MTNIQPELVNDESLLEYPINIRRKPNTIHIAGTVYANTLIRTDNLFPSHAHLLLL